MMFTSDEKANLILASIGLLFCFLTWGFYELREDKPRPPGAGA